MVRQVGAEAPAVVVYQPLYEQQLQGHFVINRSNNDGILGNVILSVFVT